MADVETKKNVIRELIERGKKKGMLTNKEIAMSFEEMEITPKELETVYDIFEKEGIEIIDDLDKELEEIEISKE